MSRRLPQIVCGFFGLLLLILFFSNHPVARTIYTALMEDYAQIIFAFTLIVGAIGFVRVNLTAIERGQERSFRLVSLAGVVAMPVLAIIWGREGGAPFMWMFDNVQVPLQTTVFALLAFYVASASYRGFRARSLPAAVLLVSAILALLSRSDLGGLVSDWITPTAEWIRNGPSMAARRAILMGIGLGSLTTSLRVILGIERTWLGGSGR
jgi:hypothetical protein